MTSWPHDQQAKFLDALSSLWPGGWIEPSNGRATEKGLAWLSAASKFHIDIAVEALREVYAEGQTGRLPALSAFRHVANGITELFEGEQRRKREAMASQAPTLTGREIAEDGQLWEDRLDAAESEDQIQMLRHMRELLRRGAKPADLARFLGDVLTSKFERATSEPENLREDAAQEGGGTGGGSPHAALQGAAQLPGPPFQEAGGGRALGVTQSTVARGLVDGGTSS